MNRLRHMHHAIPWMAVLATAIPGAVLVLVSVGLREQEWATDSMSSGLLLLALPAAFVLDDPSAPVASATPRSPWWDLTGRLLALVGLCVVISALAWAWSRLVTIPQPWLLALLPICTALVAVAASATLRRAGRATPGDLVVGALVLGLIGLSLFRPTVHTWELMPNLGSADTAEVAIWSGAAALALALIVWTSSGRGSRTAVDV
jgi:cytochrome bd-type quinol oxidase subunit 2